MKVTYNCRNLLLAKETRRNLEISAWQNLAQSIKKNGKKTKKK